MPPCRQRLRLHLTHVSVIGHRWRSSVRSGPWPLPSDWPDDVSIQKNQNRRNRDAGARRLCRRGALGWLSGATAEREPPGYTSIRDRLRYCFRPTRFFRLGDPLAHHVLRLLWHRQRIETTVQHITVLAPGDFCIRTGRIRCRLLSFARLRPRL